MISHNSLTDPNFEGETLVYKTYGGTALGEGHAAIIDSVYDISNEALFFGAPYINKIKHIGLHSNSDLNNSVDYPDTYYDTTLETGPPRLFSWDSIYQLQPAGTRYYYFKDNANTPLVFTKIDEFSTTYLISFWHYHDTEVDSNPNALSVKLIEWDNTANEWKTPWDQVGNITIDSDIGEIPDNTWVRYSYVLTVTGSNKYKLAFKCDNDAENNFITAPFFATQDHDFDWGVVPPSTPYQRDIEFSAIYSRNDDLTLLENTVYIDPTGNLNAMGFLPKSLFWSNKTFDTSQFYFEVNDTTTYLANPRGAVGVWMRKSEFLAQDVTDLGSQDIFALRFGNDEIDINLNPPFADFKNNIAIRLLDVSDSGNQGGNITLFAGDNEGYSGNTIDTGIKLTDYNIGDWVSFIVVWDKDGIDDTDDTLQLYIDGTKVGNNSSFKGFGYGEIGALDEDEALIDHLCTGRLTNSFGYANTNFKDLFITKRAFTKSEISDIYNVKMSIVSRKDLILNDTLFEMEDLNG